MAAATSCAARTKPAVVRGTHLQSWMDSRPVSAQRAWDPQREHWALCRHRVRTVHLLMAAQHQNSGRAPSMFPVVVWSVASLCQSLGACPRLCAI